LVRVHSREHPAAGWRALYNRRSEEWMTRLRFPLAAVLALLVAVPALRADVRTDEKTKFQLAGVVGKVINMFGGKAAREGVASTVAVKGDRKSTMNESTGQIIDLAEEKVYDVDVKRKTYKVTTFAELRRQMEDAQKKAEEEARKEQASGKSSEPAPQKSEKEVEVDFDVKNTGETKTINGFNTHQAIATVTVREKGKTLEESGGLVMTTDMWLAPRIAAMKEITDFDVKFAQKLYGPMVAGASPQDMAAAMAMYPQMKQALAKMNAEGGKIEGTPILTTVTMDAVKSAAQLAEEAKASDDSKPSSARSVGGLLGGLAKKAAKKDDEPKARATFLTTTVEVLKVTTDVTADNVAVPAGFKETK
jgi:hypothetical protein